MFSCSWCLLSFTYRTNHIQHSADDLYFWPNYSFHNVICPICFFFSSDFWTLLITPFILVPRPSSFSSSWLWSSAHLNSPFLSADQLKCCWSFTADHRIRKTGTILLRCGQCKWIKTNIGGTTLPDREQQLSRLGWNETKKMILKSKSWHLREIQ